MQAVDAMLRHITEKVGDVRTIHNAIVAAPVADESLYFVELLLSSSHLLFLHTHVGFCLFSALMVLCQMSLCILGHQ